MALKKRYIRVSFLTILITFLPKLWCEQKSRKYFLTVKPEHLCLNPRTAAGYITCLQFINTTRNASTALESWSLTWYHSGKALVTTTRLNQTKRVMINRVMVQSPGMFTCVSKNRDTLIKPENGSVMVGITPEPIKEIVGDPVFTEEDGFKVIKITWQSRTLNTTKYRYRLVYKLPKNEDYPFEEPAKEWRTATQLVCVGLMCEGSFSTDGYSIGNVSFYIVTSFGGCDVSSQIWSFFITLFSWHSCTAVTPAGTVLFTPPTPAHLRITTTHRKVTLNWIDESYRSYAYTYNAYYLYNCSKGSVTEPKRATIYNPSTPTIQLTDKEINPYKPYDRCTFCLFVQWYKSGGCSLPRCNTTRLYEERPSEAPTITCSSDTCPTTYDGHTRNVTITWKLPPKETWNGVLTKIIVTIYSESVVLKVLELSLTNLSLNSSTLVLTLNRTQPYVISMQACTKGSCSQRGNNLKIIPMSNEVDQSSTSYVLWIAVVCSVAVVVFIALFVVHRCLKRSPHSPSRTTLPALQEPGDHEYSAQEDVEIFDELHKDQNRNNVNSNLPIIVAC